MLLKKGARDSLFYVISILFGKALTVLIIPFLAIKLAVEDIAFYDLFLVGTNYLQLIFVLGIDSGIAVKIAENKNDKKKLSFYYTISLLLLFIIAIIIFSFSFLFNYFSVVNYDNTYILLIFIQGILISIQYIGYNYLKWLGESLKSSLIMFFGNILGVGIGVSLLFIENTLNYFLSGVILGNIIGVFISIALTYSYVDLKFKSDKKEIISLLKLSFPFFINSILNQSYKSIDRFIILYFLNSSVLGVYSLIIRICQIFTMGIEVVLGSFQAVTFLNYKTEDGIKLYNKISFLSFIGANILILVFPLAFVYLAPYFESLKIIENYLYLVPLITCSALYVSLRTYGGFAYFINNKTIYISLIIFCSLIAYILLSILLIGYGIKGVAISSCIISVIGTFYYFLTANKIQSFNENIKKMALLCTLSICISFTLFYLIYNGMISHYI